jgi:hypothetical protein
VAGHEIAFGKQYLSRTIEREPLGLQQRFRGLAVRRRRDTHRNVRLAPNRARPEERERVQCDARGVFTTRPSVAQGAPLVGLGQNPGVVLTVPPRPDRLVERRGHRDRRHLRLRRRIADGRAAPFACPFFACPTVVAFRGRILVVFASRRSFWARLMRLRRGAHDALIVCCVASR